MTFIHRHLFNTLNETLTNFDVIYLNGPRQCGKSTLAHMLMQGRSARYVTLDDYSILMQAKNDPASFLQQSAELLIIDEVQLAPELFRPLKQIIDEQRLKGETKQFLLTGSVNIMNVPALSDALVGRMALHTLYPLSISESLQRNQPELNDLFEPARCFEKDMENLDWRALMVNATYPELTKNKKINQHQWFENYITTLLQRDVRILANVEKILDFPKLLRLLSTRMGGLSNDTNVAVDASLNLATYRRYKTLLEAVFLIHHVEAWHASVRKRFIKAPKLFFIDTALALHLLRISAHDLDSSHPMFGHVFENFIASELIKASTSNDIKLYHYRDSNHVEVDFVLENKKGERVGIEVKAGTRFNKRDLKNLKSMHATENLKAGYILHPGEDFYPIDEHYYALPISYLYGPSPAITCP